MIKPEEHQFQINKQTNISKLLQIGKNAQGFASGYKEIPLKESDDAVCKLQMNNILNNFQKNTNKENDNSSKNHNSSTEMGDGDKADAGVDSIELSND